MSIDYKNNSKQSKLLHRVEHIAQFLDDAIKSGEMLDDDIEATQINLNDLYEKLKDDETLLGASFYIIYEAQSLLSWIQKDRDESQKFLEMAVSTKGSDDLLTESAKDLLSSLTDNKINVNTGKYLFEQEHNLDKATVYIDKLVPKVAAYKQTKDKIVKPKHKTRQLFFWLLVLGLIFFWTPITDYWTIATADQTMVDLADRADMSFKGKAAFLRMNPELVSDAEMASVCGSGLIVNNKNGYIEQGCYINSKIYIRDMPSNLDDMEVVTAAHELLHPVYNIIAESEDVSILNILVENNYKTNNDDKLTARIANYAETEPGYRDQELFSILGTEYSNISSDLMSYYSPYFNDNLSSVVAANTNILNIFKSDENKLVELKIAIQDYSDLANRELESANYAYYCSTTWARVGNSYENTRNYNIYLAHFKIYGDYIDKQNGKVSEYNNLLVQYNILITEYNGSQILPDIQTVQAQTSN